MDHSWINIPDKLSVEYENGIYEFISVAEKYVNSKGKYVNSKGMVLCPCGRCVNKQSQGFNVIKLHLLTHGFLSSYKIWYYHGEQIDDIEDDVIFNTQDGDPRDEQDDLAEGLNDAINTKYFDVGPTSDFISESPFNACDKYDALFKSLHKPLYDNCKISVLSAVVRYVFDLETRFSRPERNWDAPIPNHQMDIFRSCVRPLGAASIQLLRGWKNTIQWYILNNSVDEIQEYLNDHKNTLLERGLSQSDIDMKQREEFPSWFKNKVSKMQVQKSVKVNDDLYSLSQGPLERYNSYQSCIVNGVRFRCKEYDDTLRTQCSGVCTEGDHDNNDIIYYGILIEIMQLSFLFDRKVFLFRCKWYNSNPRGRSIYMDNNLTSINTSTDWYSNEPFILASQAQQVFYLLDMKRGSNWRYVQKVNHRFVFDIPETSKHVSDQPDNDVFQEEESFQLPPFQPVEDSIESSSLVRRDVASATVMIELVDDLFSNDEEERIGEETDQEKNELNEVYDDGDIFLNNNEVLCSSDDDNEAASETESEA
ncbi:hypothetical protein POM88_020272 [Heracleum sosnowskyi]|uniref:Transposase n=1 Tax=Heracleum sosnowskyi TaxID=360622 RepID=A0AAD8IB26_9APIA|nr:hypothetical protein POM88_020272 [Heracleum sosnowskyi]